MKCCHVDTNVLAIATHVTGEGFMSVATLHVVVLYLVAIFVNFHVLMNARLVTNCVQTIAVTVSVIRNVVSHVSPVWMIVNGSVGILSVRKSVVRCVITLAVIIHALDS